MKAADKTKTKHEEVNHREKKTKGECVNRDTHKNIRNKQ